MIRRLLKRALKKNEIIDLEPTPSTQSAPVQESFEDATNPIPAPERGPCAGLWKTPMVHVNGALTTCCLDEGLANKLGNLRTHSLETLWNGETITAWRHAHIEGRYDESGPLCGICNWQSAGLLDPQEAREWLKNNPKK